MTFPLQFAAHAPNRWLFTTGPADGEWPLIRLTGTTVLTGDEGPIPEPPDPTPAHGPPTIVQMWG